MTDSLVDDVLSGRRFPYSRAFARAGFSPADAEEWRRAGWVDPDDAGPWHDIDTDADAVTLLSLALEGFDVAQVRQVSRFAPRLTAAWTRALLRPHDDVRTEIDLRDVETRVLVRENLLRDRVSVDS